MGITSLLQAIKPLLRSIHIKQYSNQTVAIDGYCWIHRAMYGSSTSMMNDKDSTAWMKYCVNYVDLLLHHNIKVILVFDGDELPMKKATESTRAVNRENNLAKAQDYLKQGDVDNARTYFSRSVDVTPKMAAQLIQMLRQIRPTVQCIVAPYEADAQLSYLIRNNLVNAVISEDSDLIPYQCNRILFKLDMTGFCQELVLSELYSTSVPSFDLTDFSPEMVLTMCIVSGCDYLVSSSSCRCCLW